MVSLCQAAVAEAEPIVGSRPDPGLQAGPDKAKTPRRSTSRVNAPIDALDETIVTLPTGDLRQTAGDSEAKVEKLVYDIYVKGLPAGKCEFELKRQDKYAKGNQVPVFVASMNTRANRATSLFYDVKDRVSSIFDATGGFSRMFSMDRKEGNTKVVEQINFSYEKDGASAQYKRPRPDADKSSKDKDIDWVTSTIPLTGKTLDPLAAIYFMRCKALNLDINQPSRTKPSITLPICTDRHVWNTRLYPIGKEYVDLGSYRNRVCAQFEIDAPFKGLFERVGKIRAWFHVKSGVAVKMSAEIPIGLAEAVLNTDESKNLPKNFTNDESAAAEAGQEPAR